MQDIDAITDLRSYAAVLIEKNEEVERSSLSLLELGVAGRTQRRLAPRSRVVLLAAALVLSNVGLAAASDSAVPGDLLYPVDRAYESLTGFVGIETGGSHERIEEAYMLLAHGDVGRAIATASDAIPKGASDERAILDDLAVEMARDESSPGQSGDVHAAVAGLLQAVHGVSSSSPPGQDQVQKDEIRDRARAVAEAARGRPFEPGQGPGADEKSANEKGASADNNSGNKTDTVGNANGRDDNTGQGNSGNPGNSGGSNGGGNGKGKGKGNP